MGVRGSSLKRELIPIKTKARGEEELHHSQKIQVSFCKLRPGTAILGDDIQTQGNHVNIQQSDCR